MDTRDGVSEDASRQLLKELRLVTKLPALWKLLGLPEIDPKHLKSINALCEQRNRFVHYKWHEQPDDHSDNCQRLLALGRETVDYLNGLEDEILFDGRREELLEAFNAYTAAEISNSSTVHAPPSTSCMDTGSAPSGQDGEHCRS